MTSPLHDLPHIRLRKPEDLNACGRVLQDVHASDGYPVEGIAHPRAWLTPPTEIHSWVAVMGTRILGHVTLMAPNLGEAAISLIPSPSARAGAGVVGRLFVHPVARRQGLGEGLMRAVMNYANQARITLVLDVLTKDAAAIRLYERLGWRDVGQTDHSVGGKSYPARCYAHG